MTSLSAGGKHALPLEDRKALLVALVKILSEGRDAISKIAVSRFSAVATHAWIYLLSRAGPRTSIRLLRGEDNVFKIEEAAEILAQTTMTLYSTEVG